MIARPRASASELRRDALLRRLVDMQYERNDIDFHRGTFRVRGDVVEVFPAYEDETRDPHRVLRRRDRGASPRSTRCAARCSRKLERSAIFPARTTSRRAEQLTRAIDGIRDELRERLAELQRESKLLEAQRLEQRTMYDLEMLEQMGFCHGIENYSRHLVGPRRRASRRRR